LAALRKLLVANRGEIAVRVLATARALGYRTVAVFSDADRGALHTRRADEAVCIGPGPARDSYLRIDRLIDACRKTGADVLHPGYGFLSENAELAASCEQAGVRFVGPPAEAILLMGDKARAKARLIEAGVPVVPGYQGEAQDDATLAREAARIGYPLLVKAAAGGGGRGMRVVQAPAELMELLQSARAEAQAAFRSSALLLERLIEDARHLEVQVFGDVHGNVIHLGERECSTQRRHQKIIEESPSPAVDAGLRRRLGEAAVAVAKAARYRSAGTVEFLLAPDGQFYFLEMNTRLQVEHPVTELVTGLDLVAWQLNVAEGGRLPLAQQDVVQRGHAIEARLYAEDPYAGFLPQSGRLVRWRPPTGEGVRVDAGIVEGQEITPYYDPLLAKVIGFGETRELARRRLARAIHDTVALGPANNREFLASLLEDEIFVSARVTTRTLDARFLREPPVRPEGGPSHHALAAVLLSEPTRGSDPWRSSGRASWPVKLESGGVTRALRVTALTVGSYQVAPSGGPAVRLRIVARSSDQVRCEIEGLEQTAFIGRDGEALLLQLGGVAVRYLEPRAAAKDEAVVTSGRVVAPITGQVLAVATRAGERVARGQPLLTLTAMKMEHCVLAPCSGRVAQVMAAAGEQVSARQVLVEIEADGAAAVAGARA
jgi:geranyl-CoA carboxylase alpha subunit